MPIPRKQDWFDLWWPRLRDVGCSGVGGYLLIREAAKAHPSLAVISAAAMIMVVPAAALAQRWLRGKFEDE